jgi:2-amino-4-hydroxy-6-hydroxymethyldihydropteridine diphosphokinase
MTNLIPPPAKTIQRTPVLTVIALGANLGDAAQTVTQAIANLAQLPQTKLLKASGLHHSKAINDFPSVESALNPSPDYVNAVALVETRLNAHALLAQLQAQETAAGRERPYRHAPRTLDLDIIFYGSATIDSPTLTVPHSRWAQREFVTVPLRGLVQALEKTVTLPLFDKFQRSPQP